MIFSEQWVREWVNPALSTEQLVEQLTMAGLEVDAYYPVANQFNGIVVGEVLSVEAHPQADRLRVCNVSDGVNEFQVVCGAPNVRAGMRVPFAKVGAEIITGKSDGPLRIELATLRGVESAGMLCSTAELGLEESAEGLMELPAGAATGQDVRSYLQLDDTSIALDLTPNRGDCLGITGLAREIGALNDASVCIPQMTPVAPLIDDDFPIEISAADQCPRYLGRVIKNIDPRAVTPLWMQEKLRRCGVRSIDPVVDVTNFVLLELGQPMHAFDLSKLDGSIDVRLAAKGEKLTLLDGKDLQLDPDCLVIADEAGAVALAGIMGGQRTAVSESTVDVFLECAFFSPLALAGRARRFGMHTDASHRYERGVDYEIQHQAMERATALLLDIVGGAPGPVIEATGNLPQPSGITLHYANVSRLLGVEVNAQQIKAILLRLGLQLREETETSLTVESSSFRFDLAIEADLIEEIARVYGYANIPLGTSSGPQRLAGQSEAELGTGWVKQLLAGLGYQEVVTYSFINPDLSRRINPEQTEIALQNPISSDMSVMRQSLLPGLLSTLIYNENRQQERLRIFETGLAFIKGKNGQILQPTRLAGLVSGKKMPVNWCNNNEIYDFYDVKGDVEHLFARGGLDQHLVFVPGSHEALHPGQCAEILLDGASIGYVGALQPQLAKDLELSNQIFLFEIDLLKVVSRPLPRATTLSKFPEVSRDLAILVDIETRAADILALVYENAGENLSDIRIFDVYQGDAVEKGKKSIALGLTWQHPSRTLNDEEVTSIIDKCIKALEQKFNASLRN